MTGKKDTPPRKLARVILCPFFSTTPKRCWLWNLFTNVRGMTRIASNVDISRVMNMFENVSIYLSILPYKITKKTCYTQYLYAKFAVFLWKIGKTRQKNHKTTHAIMKRQITICNDLLKYPYILLFKNYRLHKVF